MTEEYYLYNEDEHVYIEEYFIYTETLTLSIASFKWMPNDVWLNILQLSETIPFFGELADSIGRSESIWQTWYDSNMPEIEPIPDYEMRMVENSDTGPWLRLLIIRMLRMDRTKLATRAFIRATPHTGPKYVTYL